MVNKVRIKNNIENAYSLIYDIMYYCLEGTISLELFWKVIILYKNYKSTSRMLIDLISMFDQVTLVEIDKNVDMRKIFNNIILDGLEKVNKIKDIYKKK